MVSSLPRRLGQEPLEPARQHFAHHAKVVAWGQVGGTNVEFAVLTFAKSFRSGDDHRAHRIRALDVAIVIDLNTTRHPRQAKGVGELPQQFFLRGCFRKLAAERLTGVGKRVPNQVLLFTARRHRDLDLAADLGAQRLSEERAIDDLMRNQD